MKYLITGSSGHLGEALCRVLTERGAHTISIDIKPGPFTQHVGAITDKNLVQSCMKDVDAVLHTATLHKPHIATHSKQDFINTNIIGTQMLLEAAIAANVSAFIYTSTTSAFGDALTPPPHAPAAWITEDVSPVTKNIYGATKLAAEDLCWLAHRNNNLPCLILRTSRFFPEDQDNKAERDAFSTQNSQVNEFLNRRVDIEDVVTAHLLAAERAREIGYGKYIISTTPPFCPEDLAELRRDAPKVIARYSQYQDIYTQLGWALPPTIDRVYVNALARRDLGWAPDLTFETVLKRLREGKSPLSELAMRVGSKGYHDVVFSEGPYPVE